MALHHSTRGRLGLAATALGVSTLLLAGCAGGTGNTDNTDATGESIIVGTTDKVTTLDPAGSYDNGSLAVQTQVFPYLVNTNYNDTEVVPDLAESAEFTAPNEYTVTLPAGLKWSNGHDLTSSDVKFSFDRNIAIADPNGASSLLYNLDSVEAPDDTTVVFHLKTDNDQVFPFILTSFPGAIVDEEVFSADAVTPDQDIVDGDAFGGPYKITSWDFNKSVEFTPNENYKGLLDAPVNSGVILSYFAESSNLKLAVQQGDVDVAYRSLSATDVEDLSGNDAVKVVDGPGGEIRYIVFNFNTQPYGATTADADAAKALAVRQAVADLVDREAISDQVYKGTYTPLYSYVPEGFSGAIDALKGLYGDGDGGPDAEKAKATLEAAGVTTPVELSLQYSPDHYGPSSGDEYALVKDQLEKDGLFTVNLQSTEWVQYSKDRTADVYPAYQLGWFPDYSDADNYLTPFFLKDNFLGNHYDNSEVNDLILEQAVEPDADARKADIEKIQELVAADLSTVPLLQGAQVAVTGADVSGVILDASFKLRFAPITK
ncbi:MAG: peptide ABC transporter substrate-binding protein [Microbacterium sp. SCN 70-200]|uniref:ABC transporter substrate-binding protein n=1 Tax=unclassified Microbacterium TaxID=2609290 RepID=UPI00086CCEFC|nr:MULTISPECIES: ABC transporter substrate-binding protein [unclassified Microbacterium]MBN9216158.1 peptide ABC transporter substrate-binding protein [Microbacterium sp.]ODT39639.1 MAG: peptide ABC transporter substrate-binding protein [Microbacterium sp. SCN 70-200]OJV81437.1 MAG: peptide ABC transporter substrate-binding protein [Microbacterium sp. 70-16]